MAGMGREEAGKPLLLRTQKERPVLKYSGGGATGGTVESGLGLVKSNSYASLQSHLVQTSPTVRRHSSSAADSEHNLQYRYSSNQSATQKPPVTHGGATANAAKYSAGVSPHTSSLMYNMGGGIRNFLYSSVIGQNLPLTPGHILATNIPTSTKVPTGNKTPYTRPLSAQNIDAPVPGIPGSAVQTNRVTNHGGSTSSSSSGSITSGSAHDLQHSTSSTSLQTNAFLRPRGSIAEAPKSSNTPSPTEQNHCKQDEGSSASALHGGDTTTSGLRNPHDSIPIPTQPQISAPSRPVSAKRTLTPTVVTPISNVSQGTFFSALRQNLTPTSGENKEVKPDCNSSRTVVCHKPPTGPTGGRTGSQAQSSPSKQPLSLITTRESIKDSTKEGPRNPILQQQTRTPSPSSVKSDAVAKVRNPEYSPNKPPTKPTEQNQYQLREQLHSSSTGAIGKPVAVESSRPIVAQVASRPSSSGSYTSSTSTKPNNRFIPRNIKKTHLSSAHEGGSTQASKTGTTHEPAAPAHDKNNNTCTPTISNNNPKQGKDNSKEEATVNVSPVRKMPVTKTVTGTLFYHKGSKGEETLRKTKAQGTKERTGQSEYAASEAEEWEDTDEDEDEDGTQSQTPR